MLGRKRRGAATLGRVGLTAAGTVLSLATVAPVAWADVSPARLRCEYKTDPLCVGTRTPRLSWILLSRQKDQAQGAYQIQAAPDRASLLAGRATLWDSGKVSSGESLHVKYAGRALKSGESVVWRVRTWDAAGKVSAWSAPAGFAVGLLDRADWNGSAWILPAGEDARNAEITPDGASWIWYAGDPSDAPAGKREFVGTLNLPADIRIESAQLLVSADDRYSFDINGGAPKAGPSRTDSWRNYQVYDVAPALRAGPNKIRVVAENLAASPAGVIAKLLVKTSAGTFLLVTNDSWTGAIAGGASGGEMRAAKVVGAYGAGPWNQIVSENGAKMQPVARLRHVFSLDKPVTRAILHTTALGLGEFHINGARVGDDYLSPGWTEYRKRVHALAYDVTKQLRPGENAIGALLGDGWYASYLGFTGKRHFYGGDPKLRALLVVEFADGTTARIGTDDTWVSQDSEFLYADMLMGVSADTRRESSAWILPGLPSSAPGWKRVQVATDVNVAIEPHPNEPIRAIAKLSAKSVRASKNGAFVCDIGQNLSGWARITVDGTPGQVITIRHAERLSPDGTIYTTNLRSAKATDTFVLRGGRQTIEPKFTFHGFQYVEISGLTRAPKPADVVAVAISSDLKRTSKFVTDNPLLNRLMDNIDWGQMGNFLDVPTDCPQRDERLGWTGDAQVFAKTAMFNRDSSAFFTKWLVDLVQDSQFENGSIGDVAPLVVGGGNAAWEDAGVVCTYRLWEMYGDTDAVRAHWTNLEKYMAHLATVAPSGIRGPGSYGDWLLLDGPQRSNIHGTAYYYFCAKLMAQMADAIGESADAKAYRAVAERVKAAFQKAFVTENGEVLDNGKTSQTFYALALAWDLLPETLRPRATARLAKLLAARGNHLATGFIGTPVLLQALAAGGRSDLAYQLVLNETYPSWLYQVKLGATSMWERWDGWTPEKGFQDAGMNSFNHYWLGCVAEWLNTGAAGIDTDGAGWKKIVVKPEIQPGLSRVSATYDSVRGPVTSSWVTDSTGVTLTLTVPANTTATVLLPTRGAVLVDGKPAESQAGVHAFGLDGGRGKFVVGSGTRVFRWAR